MCKERRVKKLKKGKVTVVITIAIACFALVTIMFMQFKIINQTDITLVLYNNSAKNYGLLFHQKVKLLP